MLSGKYETRGKTKTRRKLNQIIEEHGESLKRLIVKQLKQIIKEHGKKISNNKIIEELRKIPEIDEALDNILETGNNPLQKRNKVLKPRKNIPSSEPPTPKPKTNLPQIPPNIELQSIQTLKTKKKTFNWENHTFKVMDQDEFYKKLTDLTNKNIIKLTNNKQPQPKRQVNISESVRDELNEKFNQLTQKEQETALRGLSENIQDRWY